MQNIPKWSAVLIIGAVINFVCKDFVVAIATLITLCSISRYENERREMEMRRELKLKELDKRNSY